MYLNIISFRVVLDKCHYLGPLFLPPLSAVGVMFSVPSIRLSVLLSVQLSVSTLTAKLFDIRTPHQPTQNKLSVLSHLTTTFHSQLLKNFLTHKIHFKRPQKVFWAKILIRGHNAGGVSTLMRFHLPIPLPFTVLKNKDGPPIEKNNIGSLVYKTMVHVAE